MINRKCFEIFQKFTDYTNTVARYNTQYNIINQTKYLIDHIYCISKCSSITVK